MILYAIFALGSVFVAIALFGFVQHIRHSA